MTLDDIFAGTLPAQAAQRRFNPTYFERDELCEHVAQNYEGVLNDALFDSEEHSLACVFANYLKAKSIRCAVIERITDQLWETLQASPEDRAHDDAQCKADSDRD
jgi:hypothetical protein